MRCLLSSLSLAISFALAVSQLHSQSAPDMAKAEATVMRVDEEFRLAKMHNDTAALDRTLSNDFYETNQNGNSRNKEQMIDLFRGFPIKSLTTDEHHVRIAGNTAFVTGSQTEDGNRMSFMRAYVGSGDVWQLRSSMQFTLPDQAVETGVEGDVMKVDEAYRLAKLNRDVRVLDRILADGFIETNQNGNSRDKAQTIELWKAFAISSLTTDSHLVRIAGDTALVTGTQTESGIERMVFSRVYVRGTHGWQLAASAQFLSPIPGRSM